MKKIIFSLAVLFLSIINVNASTDTAHEYILMDMTTARVLEGKNYNTPMLIASITKIMTCTLAIESGKLDETVTVDDVINDAYGSGIYIEVEEELTLRDLLYGLMLRSGNDAAIVISVFVGGSEEKFVKMMNEKARQIGMKNTVFSNPHGLDEETENKSSAYDMALLSSYAAKNETYMEIAGTKKYQTQSDKKSYLWNNRNKLLFSYEFCTAGKTGYTPSAGRTLVTNASKNGLNLTIVTLNDGNEYQTHEELYEYAFSNYKNYRILDIKKFKIDDSYYPNKIYIKENFSYPLLEEEKDLIRVEVKLTKLKNYQNNDSVGIVIVKLGNEEIHTQKVYVKVKEKKNQNIFSKIWSWLFD